MQRLAQLARELEIPSPRRFRRRQVVLHQPVPQSARIGQLVDLGVPIAANVSRKEIQPGRTISASKFFHPTNVTP
jgi:hypothetical protein